MYMMHCCIQVDSISISWTSWHRINYHVHWIAYCYINSLRQPHRPTLTHIISCHVKGVSCPSLYYHFLCCHPAGSWHSSGFKRTQSSGNDAVDKRHDAPGHIALKLDKY